jgi:hypothetical protein
MCKILKKKIFNIYNNIMEFNTLINSTNYDQDLEEKNIVITKKYDYSKKMELVRKIQKIKKSEYLINIFKIIKLHSKKYNINSNGIFVMFHDLPDEVYGDIENYVNLIYKLHKKSLNVDNIYDTECSENKIIQSILSDSIELDNEKNLSNKEKVIFRRKKYEKYLNQNQDNL